MGTLSGHRVRAVHVVVALELAAILVLGLLTVARFQIWSQVDEEAHFAYVEHVVDQRRLPVLFRDVVSDRTQRLGSVNYLRNYRSVRGRPINYEAFQPPLFYLAAAPFYALAPSGTGQIYALRLFCLALLFGAIVVLWRFAGRVLPEKRWVAFALALGVLLWPGVVVRAATVSNSTLELLLTLAFLHVLWRADAERDARRLVGAGALLGLALLTKTTLVYLVPLLVFVAARHIWTTRSRRALATAVVTLVLPLALLAPWFAFNEHHFGSLTANGQAAAQQRVDAFGPHYRYGVHDFLRDSSYLLDGYEPQDWQYDTAHNLPGLTMLFEFLRAALYGIPLLGLLLAPRLLRSREALFLVAPWVFVMAFVGASSVLANWTIVVPRYTYPALPGLALFGAVVWRRIAHDDRAPVAVAAAGLAVMAVAWGYAVTENLV